MTTWNHEEIRNKLNLKAANTANLELNEKYCIIARFMLSHFICAVNKHIALI